MNILQVASLVKMWSSGSCSGWPSFWRTLLRTLSTNVQISNDTERLWQAKSLSAARSLGVLQQVSSSFCPCPDLLATLEKVARCSRSNPLHQISPCFWGPNLSNLLVYSLGFAEWNWNSATERTGWESKRPGFGYVAILQPREHLPLHVVSPSSVAST